jgi:hypothetical protein
LVDREKLCDFSGRSRKGMIALARQFGFSEIPDPSTGCALTEVGFSRKVFDLVDFAPECRRWDFDVLRVGRHFRLDRATKIVVGRNADDNARLKYLSELPEGRGTTLLEPQGFAGPTILIIGPSNLTSTAEGVGLLLRHSRRPDGAPGHILVTHGDLVSTMPLPDTPPVPTARSITESTPSGAAAG